jgi:hypothetical protein
MLGATTGFFVIGVVGDIAKEQFGNTRTHTTKLIQKAVKLIPLTPPYMSYHQYRSSEVNRTKVYFEAYVYLLIQQYVKFYLRKKKKKSVIYLCGVWLFVPYLFFLEMLSSTPHDLHLSNLLRRRYGNQLKHLI